MERRERAVDSDLPPHHQQLTEALIVASAHVDLLLDDEATRMGATPGWVAKMQNFTDWMAGEDRESEQRRASTEVLWLYAFG